MKNKSFVGIDISKNVIDVSIFREDIITAKRK